MDLPDRREILSRVAAGTMTPEEAAEQLGRLDAGPVAETLVRRVRVSRDMANSEIIGDPTVREAVAEGSHRARLDGDTLVIDSSALDDGERGHFSFLPRNWDKDRLVVRMNPALALDLTVMAGSCRVRGVTGPIKAEIQAGSCTIDGFQGPIDLSVQAGSVKASGCLREGSSRIACEAGGAHINLETGSSVHIRARSTLGTVQLPGDAQNGGTHGRREAVVGEGRATLDIETTMGSIKVSAA